ncbi:MAG: hypothetical protein AAF628_06275 [Planctomycetota bacterium]
MPSSIHALVHVGHLAGAVLGIGGALYLVLVVLPASRTLPEAERPRLQGAIRAQARKVVYTAIALLLVTGLIKWAPQTDGVGWLGHRGYRTAFLHGKIGLALVVFHLAASLVREPRDAADAARRPARARLVAGLGLLIIALATLHRTGF